MRRLLALPAFLGATTFSLPALADHLDGVVPLHKDDLAQRMHLYLETARRSPAWAFDGIVMITFADGGTTTVNMGRVELGNTLGLSHYWDRALSSLESE